VFEEVARGHIDLGIVPIENSSEGSVQETLDSFLDFSLQVYAEVIINIHHNLLAQHSIDQITRVYSKSEPLSQCRKWLGLQLPNAQCIAVASSSKAAEMAAQEPDAAAIGSTLAAEMYDLKIQFANVEDNPNNVTRFFVISNESAKPTGDDKTAAMFTARHEPGSLANVLDAFRDHGLNLTHIDKRPSRRVNWEYFFFVDLIGHVSDPAVARGIEAARGSCQQLTVLGSFPRAREVL
jgi:chorismate mutase/prephenate dehydratase